MAAVMNIDDERSPVWVVGDRKGRMLAARISRAQIRARVENGLLPRNALVAREGSTAWQPIDQVLRPPLWYVTCDGAPVIGPVDSERVRRGIEAGKVPIDALVCRVGGERWVPIADEPEFAAQVSEAAFDGELTLAVDEDEHPTERLEPPPPRRRR